MFAMERSVDECDHRRNHMTDHNEKPDRAFDAFEVVLELRRGDSEYFLSGIDSIAQQLGVNAIRPELIVQALRFFYPLRRDILQPPVGGADGDQLQGCAKQL